MQNETNSAAERAVIDIEFARAELTAAKDVEAIFRALKHLKQAQSELVALAPRWRSRRRTIRRIDADSMVRQDGSGVRGAAARRKFEPLSDDTSPSK